MNENMSFNELEKKIFCMLENIKELKNENSSIKAQFFLVENRLKDLKAINNKMFEENKHLKNTKNKLSKQVEGMINKIDSFIEP